MGQFEGNELIDYEDVCLNCRKKIYGAIDKIIADLIK